jgi:hypothetical protein
VAEINLHKLKEDNYKYLMLDLDNTLLPWGENLVSPEVVNWLNSASSMGFKLCVVSNSRSGRAGRIVKKLNIHFISNALKPSKSGFFKAIDFMNGSLNEAVMIGDQIFTDVLGGNRAGVFTILVKPIHRKELFTTSIMRIFEKVVIYFLKKRKVFPSIN